MDCCNNKKITAGKYDSYMHMLLINPPNNWLRTGSARDSQKWTRVVDSLFCIMCSLKNNAFSVLHSVIKVTLPYTTARYLMLRRFEIHSALELSHMDLLGCRTVAHICKHNKQFLKHNKHFSKHNIVLSEHNKLLSKHNTVLSKQS